MYAVWTTFAEMSHIAPQLPQHVEMLRHRKLDYTDASVIMHYRFLQSFLLGVGGLLIVLS